MAHEESKTTKPTKIIRLRLREYFTRGPFDPDPQLEKSFFTSCLLTLLRFYWQSSLPLELSWIYYEVSSKFLIGAYSYIRSVGGNPEGVMHIIHLYERKQWYIRYDYIIPGKQKQLSDAEAYGEFLELLYDLPQVEPQTGPSILDWPVTGRLPTLVPNSFPIS